MSRCEDRYRRRGDREEVSEDKAAWEVSEQADNSSNDEEVCVRSPDQAS